MRILIACGGTAGHIFPGLALAEQLRSEDDRYQIVIVVSRYPRDRECLKAEEEFLKQIYIETVDAAPLPYSFSFKYGLFTLRLLRSILKSWMLILRHRPQIAVGFGGYASFAPLVVARLSGIPTLIHEQNFVPGRANRFLARFVDRIAITFDGSEKFFSEDVRASHKVVKTGLPLRKTITSGIKNSFSGKFTILVIGGSQGAHRLNELVLSCLSQMEQKLRSQIYIFHIAGKKDVDYLKEKYAALKIESQVFGFLADMASAYRSADLLICRSGASTIFEAASFGLPCILIPHSYGTRHQKENALYLEQKGAAQILDEDREGARDLRKKLLELFNNKAMRQQLSRKIQLFHNPQAAHNLKEEIDSLYSALSTK